MCVNGSTVYISTTINTHTAYPPVDNELTNGIIETQAHSQPVMIMTNPPLHSLSRSPYNTIRCRSSATQHMKNEQLLCPREVRDVSWLWREDTTAVTHALSSLIDLNDRVSKLPLRSIGESSQGVQGCQPEGLTFRLFGSGECEPPLEDRTRERVCNLLVERSVPPSELHARGRD